MSKLIDLKGKVFGSLLVRCRGKDAERPTGGRSPRWWCVCLCGNVVLVEGGDLRRGMTLSCGCHEGFVSGHKNKKHGKSHTPEYVTWIDMHRRCYDIKDRYYKNYGGRGITICERWNKSNPSGMENFLFDMKKKPSRMHTIERVDVDKNYDPNNCRWLLRKNQAYNKTTSVKLVWREICLTQSQWARIFGLHPVRIAYHLEAGKSFDMVVTHFCKRLKIDPSRLEETATQEWLSAIQ